MKESHRKGDSESILTVSFARVAARPNAGYARSNKREKFTALPHHLTVDLLRESYFALQRRAAPGIDGEKWQQYGTGLEDRLTDLHSRVHRGAYRAKPSRRVYIPKADGRQGPLGIAALEDKSVTCFLSTCRPSAAGSVLTPHASN
jgi:retron-type reverse transcriptase